MKASAATISNEPGAPSSAGRKIGLVLEGGGAKGAFSHGFASECTRLGIKFEAVAGTSVGGLGAWIVATGQYDVGDRLWPALNFSNIYGPRIAPWKWVAALLFVLHAYTYWSAGLPPFFERTNRLNYVLIALFRTAIFMPLGLIAAYVLSHAVSFWWFVPFLVFLIYYCFSPLENLKMPKPMTKWEHWHPSRYGDSDDMQSGVTCQFLAMLSLVFFGCTIFALVRVFLGIYTGFDIAILIYACALTAMRISSGMTNLSDTPLSRIIDDCLNVEPVISCFVTTAAQAERYTPDHPKVEAFSYDVDDLRYSIIRRTLFLPAYHDLKDLPVSDRRTLLRATAALPFGLVKSLTFKGTSYVDGGMADNLPVYPLVTLGLDLIVCVRLRRAEGKVTQKAHAEAEANRVAEFLDLPETIPFSGSYGSDEELLRKFFETMPVSSRASLKVPPLHVVCPTEDLGGLLDFSRGDWKLEQGAHAARAFHSYLASLP